MSNNDLPTNETPKVTRLHREVPETASRLPDEPYTTPSRAIAAVLKKGGFDEEAIDAGLLEVRILAEFGKEGCMIHAVGAVRVPPPSNMLGDAISNAMTADLKNVPKEIKLDAPAMTVLRMLADKTGHNRSHYVNVATTGEITDLDAQLRDASLADLELLVHGTSDDQLMVAERLKAQQVVVILTNLRSRA